MVDLDRQENIIATTERNGKYDLISFPLMFRNRIRFISAELHCVGNVALEKKKKLRKQMNSRYRNSML